MRTRIWLFKVLKVPVAMMNPMNRFIAFSALQFWAESKAKETKFSAHISTWRVAGLSRAEWTTGHSLVLWIVSHRRPTDVWGATGADGQQWLFV